MPKGTPLTEEEQEKRRHEIFHRVVNVFLKKGFQETSMREIAEAAGLGKSTLYDYILIYYFIDQLSDLTEAAQKIAMQNKSADRRLREVVKIHLEYLQANKNLFMKLSMEAQRLKLESQSRIQDKRHAYQDLVRALIDEGVREGAFRKVDPLLAARMITAMVPVVFTSRPTGASQEALMKDAMDIFFKGIEL
jgi:AcrR family transcriptional regulator